MVKDKSSVSSVIPSLPVHAPSMLATGVTVDSKKCGSTFSRLTLEDYGFSKTPLKTKRSKKYKLPKRSSSAQ